MVITVKTEKKELTSKTEITEQIIFNTARENKRHFLVPQCGGEIFSGQHLQVKKLN